MRVGQRDRLTSKSTLSTDRSCGGSLWAAREVAGRDSCCASACSVTALHRCSCRLCGGGLLHACREHRWPARPLSAMPGVMHLSCAATVSSSRACLAQPASAHAHAGLHQRTRRSATAQTGPAVEQAMQQIRCVVDGLIRRFC